MRRPIDPPIVITTVFGVPDSNAYFGYHSGVDYYKPSGSPVYAPVAGKIWWAGWSTTGGNMVILYDGSYYHRLMHNSKLLVNSGDVVAEGLQIAVSGSTGLATGPHVHWDIAGEMLNALRPSSFSKFIDPAAWLEQGGSMGFNYNGQPTDQEKAEHYRNRMFREATEAELANHDDWGKVLDDNVTELGKRLEAAETELADAAPSDFVEVTEKLFRKA